MCDSYFLAVQAIGDTICIKSFAQTAQSYNPIVMHTNAMYSFHWYKEKSISHSPSPPRHECVHLMALSTRLYASNNIHAEMAFFPGIYGSMVIWKHTALSSSLFLLALISPTLLNALPVRRISTGDRGQLRLPLVAVREQLLLVVQQLLARLGGVLGVGALDNGVHGARLLAEAAVDALGHVDVVAGRAAGAVGALLGLDRDGLGRADGLAQLAGDAALLAGRVAAQGVLAAEAWRDGALLEWVEDCVAGGWGLVGVSMPMAG